VSLRLVISACVIGTALGGHALSARAGSQSGAAAGVGCIPAAERAGRSFGCFVVTTQPVGALEGPTFWHVESFKSRAAAERAKSSKGTVLEALDQVWLMTIAGKGLRSAGGKHVAEVGPLPTTTGVTYTAQFMEAVFQPGMKSVVHRHSGPEAWYTLSGQACLETPDGMMVSRAGGSHVIVPGGPPMELTATGTEVRRSLVLILHDSGQPPTTPAPDWKPRGLCK
jgi:quercetin dioxygenase-like cupin family protein